MRTIVLAASLIASLTAASVALAQTKADGTVKQGQMAKKVMKKTKGTTGVTGTTVGSFAVELTAEECTSLGGSVHESADLCKSGKYCGTTDQNGKRNRVCLEASE